MKDVVFFWPILLCATFCTLERPLQWTAEALMGEDIF